MKVLTTDTAPGMAEILERRRLSGMDRFDEMWDGVCHLAPGPTGRHGSVGYELIRVLQPYADTAGVYGTSNFNVGESASDYRVPDAGYHRDPPLELWLGTAAIIVEILSPDDETWQKFDFYAAHDVEEIVVADPATRTVRCWHLDARSSAYVESPRSAVLDVGMRTVEQAIRWL